MTMAASTQDVILTLGNGITVRRYRRGDEHDVVKHADNHKIWLNLADSFPSPYTLEEAKKWIEHNFDEKEWTPTLPPDAQNVGETDEAFQLRRQASATPVNFAICHDDKFIGSCGLAFNLRTYPRTADMGYWLGEEYWGKGIMTKVAAGFLQWGFDALPWVVRIESGAYSWNPASAKVLQKIGMQPEAVLRLAAYKEGKYGDVYRFAKIREGFIPDIRK